MNVLGSCIAAVLSLLFVLEVVTGVAFFLRRSFLLIPHVRRRMTIWSHPAFAMQSVFARNDREIVRVSLAVE